MISCLSYDTSSMTKCADWVHLVWQNIRDHAPRGRVSVALTRSTDRREDGASEQPCAEDASGGSLPLQTQLCQWPEEVGGTWVRSRRASRSQSTAVPWGAVRGDTSIG